LNWKLLLSTFGLLFIAELGDKTQLAVLTMTCQHQRPLPIFLGATAALTLVTLIGVLCGQGLTQFVPADLLRKVAAVAFVIVGILVWFDVM
jgi:putative Ca2+/H+ antiporter (TMEM165/GDT1 family)